MIPRAGRIMVGRGIGGVGARARVVCVHVVGCGGDSLIVGEASCVAGREEVG